MCSISFDFWDVSVTEKFAFIGIYLSYTYAHVANHVVINEFVYFMLYFRKESKLWFLSV